MADYAAPERGHPRPVSFGSREEASVQSRKLPVPGRGNVHVNVVIRTGSDGAVIEYLLNLVFFGSFPGPQVHSSREPRFVQVPSQYAVSPRSRQQAQQE